MSKGQRNPIGKPKNQPVRTQVERFSAYQGPIPQASELEHFERIEAGLASRIVAMAEKEAQHRHDKDKIVTEARVKISLDLAKVEGRGQICAVWIGTVLIVCTTLVFLFSNETWVKVASGCFGGGYLVAVVSAFLKRDRNEEPEK
jgi:uncharacterized membrane protein